MKWKERKTGWLRHWGLTAFVLVGLLGLVLVGYNPARDYRSDSTGSGMHITAESSELKELVNRSAGIEGLSYRAVTNYPMWSHETRVWMQGDVVKTETVVDGETLILVIDNARGELLSYDAAQNAATVMSLGEGHVSMPESPLEYVRELDPAEWVPGETTFFDGLRCRRFTREDLDEETVMYIWEEYGLPLRVESTVDGRTTLVEFREMEVGRLPQDVFDLPAGVQVMDFWEDELPE